MFADVQADLAAMAELLLYERGIITKEKAYELADSKGLSDEEKQILADILDPVVPESTEETPEEETSEEE
ncbi:unnamed protein product [Cylicocyclus nassatus]|uniref:Uncharacterized protein n=1 Tax=Cylicocyclus nassatus TaxID=53992 RepID=A0AA36DUE4_CYLNA|nr:unnamed protein product [Cylicocyclus nassatus]